MDKKPKPVAWIASSKKDMLKFPKQIIQDMGYALYESQIGGKAPQAKPLKGFGGASILEIVDNHDGDTYRAVYTVKFDEIIYVLHCFQKKAKSGVATPQQEIELVKTRLKIAEEEQTKWQNEQKKKSP